MKRVAVFFTIFAFSISALAAETYGPYQADVVRVIDGDNVELDVHIWPGLIQRISLRLAGVDTPEKYGSACERKLAAKATEFTTKFLDGVNLVTVQDIENGKYAGRVLGRLLMGEKDLAKELIEAKLARPYKGGKRKKWC